MQPPHAQQFPETERQKAEELRERANEARKKAAIQSHEGANTLALGSEV
jgi:hypothetical protein